MLGTAQLAADYGIANTSGAPDRREVHALLSAAWAAGIRRYDTAPAYGSEQALGEFVSAHGLGEQIRVLTKIPELDPSRRWRDDIRRSAEASLARLGVRRIEVLFFHHSDDSRRLRDDPAFCRTLCAQLPIGRLGVSVYEPADVWFGGSAAPDLACQFPSNVLDRRFAGVAMAEGCRYARSVFLQGVLASPDPLRAAAPEGLAELHRRYHRHLAGLGLNPVGVAMSAVLAQGWVDYVLFGAERVSQLRGVLSAPLVDRLEAALPPELVEEARPWVDPRRW